MPEIDLEGSFDIGGDDSAVDEAFAEAFRRADGSDTGAESEAATPAEPAATEDADQSRDDQGRFTPKNTPAVYEDPEDEPDEPAAEEPQADADVTEFLAKYGNDPDKALKAAAELSKLQGRQGNELGQLRQELESLRTRVETPAQPQAQIPITAEVVEDLDQQAMTNPQAALARADQIDPTGQLTNRVMDIWFATNPREASAAQAIAVAAETAKLIRAEYEPLLANNQQSEEDKAFTQAWDLALAQKPDMNDAADEMTAVLQGNDALASAVLSAPTPEARAQLLLGVYQIAKASAPAGPDPEVERIAKEQIAAEDQAAKTRARVAKPSAVGAIPGSGAGGGEQTEESRIKAGILGASSSDILSGLTTD